MKPVSDIVAHDAPARTRAPFAALALLLVLALLLGGSSKDYAPGLIVLRPLAVIALAIGLCHMRREHWARAAFPLGFMAASVGLIALHLVPLPPSLWTALPGRELAVLAGEAAGIEQPWRPIALVPYRGWNALFAALVPAAIAVCAVQLDREQHRVLALLVLAGVLLSAAWGAVQAISGYSAAAFFYGAPRVEVPNGLFANRNHLAALLVCSVPVFALEASRGKGGRAALAIIACAALGGFAVMMALATGSRAGMAALLVAMAGGGWVWIARPGSAADQPRGRRQPAWVPFAFGAFGLAALATFALVLSRTTGFQRLQSAGAGEVEELRFTVWRTIIDFAPSYLPVGSGIGSFVEVFKVHEPNAMLAQSYWNHAHNDWLEWAMEGGVPAIGLMALALAGWSARALALVRASLAARRSGNIHRGRIEIQLALAGAIILFVLGAWSLVDYPLRTPALASLAALSAVWMALPDLSGRKLARRSSAPGQAGGFASTGPARR